MENNPMYARPLKGEIIKITPDNKIIVIGEDKEAYSLDINLWSEIFSPSEGFEVLFYLAGSASWLKCISKTTSYQEEHSVKESPYNLVVNKLKNVPNSPAQIGLSEPNGSNSRAEIKYELGVFETYKLCWRNCKDFSGRSRRHEFWFFLLGFTILSVICLIIFAFIAGIFSMLFSNPWERGVTFGNTMAFLTLMFIIIHILPTASLVSRRLHDMNTTGWLTILAFIPYLGTIFYIIIGCINTHAERNKWGDPAK